MSALSSLYLIKMPEKNSANHYKKLENNKKNSARDIKSKALNEASNLNLSKTLLLTQNKPKIITEDKLHQLGKEYEINEKLINKLQILNDFKIVYIFDDSGSMSSRLQDSPLNSIGNLVKARRWDELKHYSKISIGISTLCNTNGCDVYFLNRAIVRNVKSSLDLKPFFEYAPHGVTPLRETFNTVVNDNIQATKESKLLVVIVTDGEPTDINGTKSEVKEFKKCLKNRNPINNIFVSIVACTDDNKSIKYLDKWDREIKNLDVVDDFRNERDQIRKINGNEFPFSYGDYVVKSLIGSIYPKSIQLNQFCCTIA